MKFVKLLAASPPEPPQKHYAGPTGGLQRHPDPQQEFCFSLAAPLQNCFRRPCLLAIKSVSFYFTAMFRFWCLRFTNANKRGLLNLSPILQCSMAQWPSTEEHVFKFHSLNAEQIFFSSQLKINEFYRQSIVT